MMMPRFMCATPSRMDIFIFKLRVGAGEPRRRASQSAIQARTGPGA
jgi:hypothetical protein